jgi:hypothetical protein
MSISQDVFEADQSNNTPTQSNFETNPRCFITFSNDFETIHADSITTPNIFEAK